MSESTLDQVELLKALRYDCVVFFAFHLGDELSMEVPEFHEDIWSEILHAVNRLNQGEVVLGLQKLFAVPREHAKSTIAKLAVILLVRYTPLFFVLYVSKTQGLGKAAINDILMWLQSPESQALYGPTVLIKESNNEGLFILKITTRDEFGTQKTKLCIFKALGAEQQVRGMLLYNTRPQIIVVDDVEDTDNTTDELQPKLDRWFFGSLLKAFARVYFCLFIGNMLSEKTILARLSKDPDWNPTVFGSLIRDKEGALAPLWPGRHTVESLLKEYAMFRRNGQGHTWEAEMMNLTQEAIFRLNMQGTIRYPVPMSEELESGCIVLDPAFGKERWSDDSAFTVHVRIKGKPIPCIIESVVGKYDEVELLQIFIDLSFKWGLTTWVIEANAAQKLLFPIFRLLLKEMHVVEGYFVMIPVTRSNESKGSAILAFRKVVRGGSYALAEDQFVLETKLGEYNPQGKEHDDHCDSAAYGSVVWEYHGATIEFQGIKQVAMQAYGTGADETIPTVQDSSVVANW